MVVHFDELCGFACGQVEQYHNVIFHGLEGSFQDYIANQISHYIKVTIIKCFKYSFLTLWMKCKI